MQSKFFKFSDMFKVQVQFQFMYSRVYDFMFNDYQTLLLSIVLYALFFALVRISKCGYVVM